MMARFLALWDRHCADAASDAGAVAWQRLTAHYAEPHRKYHNLEHLDHCLAQFDAAPDVVARADEVEMAIWFHDVIHQPGHLDNETCSAALFRDAARGVMEESFIARVMALIEATTHRTPPSDPAAQFLCDVDLSSFGMPWAVYLEDTLNLMHEFRGTKEAYYVAQRAFLEGLLERPRVFFTDVFHQRFETQARDNVKAFIELIEQRKI